MVAGGLANCVNLISFSWTRDGTLRSCHLENLAQLPCVKELEFNGHDAGWYDARVLQKFTTLEKITVIMPSSTVARTLVPWMQVSVNALRSLTIICKVRLHKHVIANEPAQTHVSLVLSLRL